MSAVTNNAPAMDLVQNKPSTNVSLPKASLYLLPGDMEDKTISKYLPSIFLNQKLCFYFLLEY